MNEEIDENRTLDGDMYDSDGGDSVSGYSGQNDAFEDHVQCPAKEHRSGADAQEGVA